MSTTSSEYGDDAPGGVCLTRDEQPINQSNRPPTADPHIDPQQDETSESQESPNKMLETDTQGTTSRNLTEHDPDNLCGHRFVYREPNTPSEPHKSEPSCPFCLYKQAYNIDKKAADEQIKAKQAELERLTQEINTLKEFSAERRAMALQLSGWAIKLSYEQDAVNKRNQSLPEGQKEQRNCFAEASAELLRKLKGKGKATDGMEKTSLGIDQFKFVDRANLPGGVAANPAQQGQQSDSQNHPAQPQHSTQQQSIKQQDGSVTADQAPNQTQELQNDAISQQLIEQFAEEDRIVREVLTVTQPDPTTVRPAQNPSLNEEHAGSEENNSITNTMSLRDADGDSHQTGHTQASNRTNTPHPNSRGRGRRGNRRTRGPTPLIGIGPQPLHNRQTQTNAPEQFTAGTAQINPAQMGQQQTQTVNNRSIPQTQTFNVYPTAPTCMATPNTDPNAAFNPTAQYAAFNSTAQYAAVNPTAQTWIPVPINTAGIWHQPTSTLWSEPLNTVPNPPAAAFNPMNTAEPWMQTTNYASNVPLAGPAWVPPPNQAMNPSVGVFDPCNSPPNSTPMPNTGANAPNTSFNPPANAQNSMPSYESGFKAPFEDTQGLNL